MPETKNAEEVRTDAIEESSTPGQEDSVSETASTPVVAAEVMPINSEETVTIKKVALEAMMDRLEKLETTVDLQLRVTDKNKVLEIERLRNSGKLVKSVKVRKYAGKYVVGWKTLEDEVYKDENNRLIEKQTVELYFDDGSKMSMSMRQWASAPQYVPFEVKKEFTDEEGNIFFSVVGADGKELELNAAFIN